MSFHWNYAQSWWNVVAPFHCDQQWNIGNIRLCKSSFEYTRLCSQSPRLQHSIFSPLRYKRFCNNITVSTALYHNVRKHNVPGLCDAFRGITFKHGASSQGSGKEGFVDASKLLDVISHEIRYNDRGIIAPDAMTRPYIDWNNKLFIKSQDAHRKENQIFITIDSHISKWRSTRQTNLASYLPLFLQ